MKSILLAAMNGVLILFTVLVHKIIFRILGLGYDNLVIYWGLFVLIFFIFDVILNFSFLKDKARWKIKRMSIEQILERLMRE